MVGYILRRLALVLLIMLLVSVIIFAITEILPGDVATMILGSQATPDTLAALRVRLGLDVPAPVRYFNWLAGVLRGDWGESLYLGIPVRPILLQRLRNSLALAILALVGGVPLGILLGTVAGLTRDRWPDTVITISTLLAISFPEFVMGGFLIVGLASKLRWLPVSSLIEPDANLLVSLPFLILPALTLMLRMLAHLAHMIRSSLIEVMASDYIRTAIAKGLPMHRVVIRHALRNSLPPTISVIALNIGYLMGGLIVVESVFAYPGLGRLILLAVTNQDIPLLQAATLVITAIYSLANLAADLLILYVNPRLRYT